jgi:hypothetical protein
VYEAVARLVVAAVLAEEASIRPRQLLPAVGVERLDRLVAGAPAPLVLEAAFEVGVARQPLGHGTDLGAEAVQRLTEGGVQ